MFYGQYTGFGSGGGVSNSSLFDILTDLSLTTNLELCLDAGDSVSYTSGQSWLDRSGNGFDFFLGASGSVASDDPTFNGTAGGLSSDEYWSTDGGDLFKYDSANETWMKNLGKNGAVFTIFTVLYIAENNVGKGFCGTDEGGGSGTGIGMFIEAEADVRMSVRETGTTQWSKRGGTAFSQNAWHMLAVSVNEPAGSGGSFFWGDGAYNQVSGADTFDGTYGSAPTTDPGSVFGILSNNGDNEIPLQSGSRMAAFAAWEGSLLSKAQLDNIWTELRGRFDI